MFIEWSRFWFLKITIESCPGLNFVVVVDLWALITNLSYLEVTNISGAMQYA